eukprot:CAMPEP_0179119724 /NCGR_PEP_ID=MMETSP0796-20121207/56376_1 /TAXON_ID=73915 /ORGANISM="Pyrodinium bahamense, Strain pbaha01" /LENGTH=312 /DNA_ID=CAMNT_0020818241 /DNA_START=71 /DNA_END=1007 /DNA_ORIENTATION=+
MTHPAGTAAGPGAGPRLPRRLGGEGVADLGREASAADSKAAPHQADVVRVILPVHLLVLQDVALAQGGLPRWQALAHKRVSVCPGLEVTLQLPTVPGIEVRCLVQGAQAVAREGRALAPDLQQQHGEERGVDAGQAGAREERDQSAFRDPATAGHVDGREGGLEVPDLRHELPARGGRGPGLPARRGPEPPGIPGGGRGGRAEWLLHLRSGPLQSVQHCLALVTHGLPTNQEEDEVAPTPTPTAGGPNVNGVLIASWPWLPLDRGCVEGAAHGLRLSFSSWTALPHSGRAGVTTGSPGLVPTALAAHIGCCW